jgi:hypothetical protein
MLKHIQLPSGELLTYWSSDSGTYTVEVQLVKDVPVGISSIADSTNEALLTLAARFRTLAISLDNLARE